MSSSSQIETRFSGISNTSTYPPHNGLAVGPNNIVMVEGARIEWTNLTGGAPVLQSVYNFFSSLNPTGGLYDPRCVYDGVNQRYVVAMEYGATGASAIDIAVSKDSNPNDGWYFTSLNTSLTINGQLTASDRPMLSCDGTNIYITADQDNVNGGYAGTECWVIGDTAGAGGGIYNGGTMTVVASQLAPSNQGDFTVVAGDNGKAYYASDYSNGSQIVVTLQSYDVATNTFGPSTTIGLGNIDQGGTYTAQQLGTSLLLDAGDKRTANLVYANGFLYGVAEMKPIGSSVPEVHWFKIDVSNPNAPTLVAQGDVSGASIGGNVATFNGSIAVDAVGDVLINFTASGPNMYPGDYYVFHGANDPAGSFSSPILYQAGAGYFNSGNGSSVQRWGLYSSTVVDPNNPNSFWLSNEYVANGWWQTANAQVTIQNAIATPPTISSVVASGSGITSGSGDLNAGHVVTLTVNFSTAVTVNTAGGTPTLALNDGGAATYASGTGTAALTFSYTVAAGQNTADLVVSAFNLNGATISDGAGNAADLSGATNYNPAGILQIDTTAPSVSAIVASGAGITGGNGVLGAGSIVTLTVNFSEAVTVNTTSGSPTLALNDGGSATYTGGSGSTALTFSYTTAAGQNTSDLVVSAFNLNGATVTDAAANAADLSGATNYNPAGILQIDTTAPSVSAIVASGAGITAGNGVLGTGSIVTLTVNFSTTVTVNTTGGTPTLALNDGGIASYTGGSGSNALTFSYTVAVGQNTPDLTVTALNLGGATISDSAGNAADLSGATNYNPSGTLQINTTALSVSSIATSGSGITSGNGDLNAGHAVTLTVNFSSAATVNTAGGTPTLALNDGGIASYTGGSGTGALTFSYAVAAGQNTPDLAVASFNLNGATVQDGAGNTADLSGAANNNPAGTLQIDTTAPVPVFTQEPASVSSSSTAAFAFGTSNPETNGVAYAYELDGATTWTPVTGSTLSLSGLANGAHTIQIQATDGAGNLSTVPASYNWTIAPATAQTELEFSGISVTSTYPPDNGLAAGPNNLLMAEGSRIEWTNLTGGAPVLQSVYNFFSSLNPTGGLYDPHFVYDSANQRYVMIMEYGATGASAIDIAVSKDSNPNDGWYFTSLNTSLTINGQLTASDRPMLSCDGTNIYITADQDNVNGGYAGTECWVIGDTAGAGGGIYNGGTMTIVASQLAPPSQGDFTVVAGNNGKTYYASDYSNGSQIVVTLQSYDVAANTFGPSTTIGLGNIDQGGTYTAQQLGTSLLLDAGDKRTADLVYANGFLYGVAEMKPIGSSVPEVHWFKIDVSNPNAPTLVAQGDVSGASIGGNVATFNGSIAVDAVGDVLINFTASGPNMYAGDYYVYQKAGDPAGSFSAPILYQAGSGFFNSGDGSSVQRWGLYSSTAVDPNNPNSFWLSNEYVANGWWQTAVAQVALDPAEPPTLAAANTSLTVQAGGSVPLGITATPSDSDDSISLTISGVPTYETITAPNGYSVTSSLQADGTNAWTIAESASTTGTPLTGLTLSSSYTGTDHPVAALTITASNTTAGESASAPQQNITITDPPAMTAAAPPMNLGQCSTCAPSSAPVGRLAALMDQFTTAGFRGVPPDAGMIASAFGLHGGHEDRGLLAIPHHA